MASQQSLNMIANPTGGGLAKIGQAYLQSKLLAGKDRRADEKAGQDTEKYQFDKMDRGSKAVQGLAKDAIDWYKNQTGTPTNEEFKAFQDEQYNNAPDVLKEYAKKEFQTIDQYNKGYETATNIQNYLHPDEKETPSIGAISGYVIDSAGDRVTSGILSSRDGIPRKLVNGKNVPLEKGEQFIQGEVKDTSENYGGKTDISKGNEKWREKVIMGGETSRQVISQNKAMLQLNAAIQGGSFTEFMAKGSNILQSVFGLEPDFISNNSPADVYAQASIHADAFLTRSGEKLKGSTSDRDLKVMDKAQGTSVDNPNDAVKFMGRQIIAYANEEYGLSKAYDTFTAELPRKATDSDDARFRKQYRVMREKLPFAVIHDKSAGHKGFSFKWEYDIRTQNNIDRALATLEPISNTATQSEINNWVANRDKVERTLKKNAENQWIKFAAENR